MSQKGKTPVQRLGPEERGRIWRAFDLTCGWRKVYAWFEFAEGGAWWTLSSHGDWTASVAGSGDVTTEIITHGRMTEGIIFEEITMEEALRR